MLDAGTAVWNLGEIVAAEFFLLLKTKGTMVGGHDLQSILRKTLPQLFLVPFLTQRRRENIFRAFESGHVHIFKREIEILRASLGIRRQPAVARLANFFEGFVAG